MVKQIHTFKIGNRVNWLRTFVGKMLRTVIALAQVLSLLGYATIGFIEPVNAAKSQSTLNRNVINNSTLNAPETNGSITVVKKTIGGNGTFGFSSADADLAALNLTTSGGIVTGTTFAKPDGIYTISEDSTPGWLLTDLTITGDIGNNSSIDLLNKQASINLSSGDAINIVYSNQAQSDPTLTCSAKTLALTATYPMSTTNWTRAQSLPQFDPAIGTLESVLILGSIAISNSAKTENQDAEAQTITSIVAGNGLIRDTFGTVFTASVSQVGGVFDASIYDGVEDYAGSSGIIFPSAQAANFNYTLLSGAQIAPYIGLGSNTFTMTAKGTGYLAGSGNHRDSIRNSAEGMVTVQYCYTPFPTDWGDLPNTYGTTTNSSGANHIITPGLQLGASIDAETDGQPSVTATGDGSDEDGVLSGLVVSAGSSPVIQVNVVNTTSQAATLYGFIDLDNNGTFSAGESAMVSISANGAVGGSTYVLNFTGSAPQVTVPTTVYARFRLSTQAGLTSSGDAVDGEVEDYVMTINPPYTGAITVTKQLSGTAPAGQTYDINVVGPSGYVSNTTLTAGQTTVFTNLVAGVYTVTEATLTGGWQVTYTASSSSWVTQTISGSQAVLTVSNPSSVAAIAPAQFAGKVYRDFNADGSITANGTTTDTGVSSVTVSFFDPTGASAGSTTTDASGLYTFTPTLPGPWRVEFTHLPENHEPSRVFTGTQNGTTVQFVTSAPVNNIDLGILEPCDYCQANPKLVFSRFESGTGTGTNSSNKAVGTISYNHAGSATIAATFGNVGSVWGLSYNRLSKRIYTSAFLKRHVGLGPRGMSGIYVIDNSGATPTLLGGFTLEGVAASNGGVVTVGSVTRSGGTDYTLSVDPSLPTIDLDAFAKVGKVGYGDIDIAEDSSTLWLVNLNDRTLVAVDTAQITPVAGSTANAAPSAAVRQYRIASSSGASGAPLLTGAPACTAGQLRPFGLKITSEIGYLGVICDASSSSTLKKSPDLHAYVLSFDPANPTALTTEVSFGLDYTREPYYQMQDGTNVRNGEWQRWMNTWTDTDIDTNGTTANCCGNMRSAPQPILSDIEVMPDGSLVIGMMDRLSQQTGWENRKALSGDTSTLDFGSVGDVLLAKRIGASYVMESGETDPSDPYPDADGFLDPEPGYSSNDSVGNAGEFFYGDAYKGADASHHETSLGGLTLLRGSNQVVMTSFDPDQFNAQGLAWLSTKTGAKADSWSHSTNTWNVRLFGKSDGMGDVELLCDAAPLEIGNRVWNDLNSNGIQDAGEFGLNGVQVSLQTPTTTLTTLTAKDGNYYFNVAPYTQYTITINSVPTGKTLTAANTDAISGSTLSNDAINDVRDSDATSVAGIPTLYYTTGGPGMNNHGLDFGFTTIPTGTTVITNTPPTASLGNRIWLDTNKNGVADVGEQNVGAGIDVLLYQDNDGNGLFSAGDTLITNTQTNSSGYYTFTNLVPSTNNPTTNYLVVITSSNFITGPLAGYVNSAATVAASKLATDNNKDHGTAFGTGSSYYVASSAIQLTAGDQPTGEGNEGNDSIQATRDANSNQTIDFGFYKLSVGNQIWIDANDNGIKDGAEMFAGSGIAIAILDTLGNVISTTTTDSSGTYLFTGLLSGTYVISVTPPSGYRSSTGQVITDGLDLNDHGTPSGAYIVSAPFDLTPGGDATSNETVNASTGATTNLNLDFGLYAPKAALGNRIWLDANNNGVADAGEQNVGAGVALVLYQDSDGNGVLSAGDALISTTQTNSSGYYTFTNLTPSTTDPTTNYLVVITSSNFITGPLAGYVNSSGQSVAGSVVSANDTDHGAPFGTGNNLYVASSAIPLTVDNQPTGEGNEGNDPVQSIRDTDSDQTIDFGFYKLMLGDDIWEDYNNNGIHESAEPGIANVLLELRDAAGNVISTTTTNASGLYTFTGLMSGTYRVVLSDTNFLPGGVLVGMTSSTGKNGSSVGPFELGANEGNSLTGDRLDHGTVFGTLGQTGGIVQSGIITLTPNFEPLLDTAIAFSQQPTVDFGLFKPAQVGNYVWYDLNHDGIQDNYPGEMGVPGVTVTLLLNGNPISTTYTDGTGHYSFTNLISGTNYSVHFDLPAGLTTTVQTAGAPEATTNNSDIAPEANSGTTAWFELGYGQSDPDIDAGVWQPASLGDVVWVDQNGNGLQDVGEAGVPGVTVRLFINDPVNGWTPLSQTVTGNGGYYDFNFLISATYTMSFSLPQGYTWTQLSADTAVSATDSNVISTTQSTAPIVLNAGERNPTIDGGIMPFAKLGDYVWEDYNHDGYQNANEPAVPGVTVTLYLNGAVYSSTVTDAAGYYTFPQLISGTYTVTFAIPQNFTFTTQTTGSSTGLLSSNLDSNVTDLSAGSTAPIVLNWGEVNPTIDAGIYQPLSLGNRVWYDTNDDGIDNDGVGGALESSTGIEGVTLTLYIDGNDDGVFTLGVDTWVADTQTDLNGYYTFTGLMSETYLVVLPQSNFMVDGKLLNYQNSDLTMTGDSDLNQNDHGAVNGILGAAGGYVASGAITLQYNTEPVNDGDANSYTNYSIDFGFYKLEIGNLVWLDLNNDGIKQSSEAAAPSVKVELLDANGIVISTTTTDSSGLYTFTNLVSGTYQVQVTPLAGYRSSTGQDTDDTTDDNDNGRSSASNPALIVSEPFSLIAGAEPIVNTTNGTSRNTTIDFGLYQPMVNLGNQVWFDTNDNGLIDGTEVGVNGVTVKLYVDTNNDGLFTIGIDQFVSATTTSSGGFYTFTQLPEGDYLVVIPASNFAQGGTLYNYKSSDVDATTPNDNIDSDDNGIPTVTGDIASRAISLTVGSEPAQTIAAGDSNWSVDFGFYKMTLGNVVWEDYNNNGIHDAGEPGIAGVTVKLYDATGTTVISSTTTDANGIYTFTNIVRGTYVVGIVAPAVATGVPYQSSLGTGGESDPESNIDDTSASVSDNGAIVMPTAEIRSNPITLTAGAEPTVVNATGSTTNNTLDFGLFRPASLGNYVWFDQNRDGMQNEPTANGMNNMTVTLYYNGVPSLTQVTANDVNGNPGYYNFTGLVSGTYTVEFTLPANYTWTQQIGQLTSTLNSDVNPLGTTSPATILPGTSNPYVDAGLKLWPVSLGNRVWRDSNNNGSADVGEQNIAGVAVQLYLDSDGSGGFSAGDTLVSTTVTSANGYYNFVDLVPSDGKDPKTNYLVVIPASNFASGGPLAGLLSSTATTAPSKDSADNDKDHGASVGNVVASGPIALTQNDEPIGEPNEAGDKTIDRNSNQTIDFGFWTPGQLGNYVWVDSNNDGIQNEPAANGVNGITATLFISDPIAGWVALSSTVTHNDANGNSGYYTFTNLLSGTYYVQFSVPTGYTVTAPTPGTATGNDAGATGQTAPILLTSEAINPNIDMGLWVPPLSLGNQVWNDLNNNGRIDAGEVGVAGVTVELYKDTNGDGKYSPGIDVKVATSTTVAGGYYTFTNLIPGDYVVVLPASNFASDGALAGYRSSDPTNTAPNNNVDGDDNGAPNAQGDVVANAITLFPFTEPTSDGDTNNNTNWTVDFGVWLPAGLGDRVWRDNNGNGQQDAGELGVDGVTVTLQTVTGTLVTHTDLNGNYVFTGLLPGTYTVTFDLPAGMNFSSPNTGGNDAMDSDANPITGSTSPVTLAPGEYNPTLDAGVVIPASLGNYVWIDVNQNGIQENGETPVAGITVTLFANGQVVSTTVTNANGLYQFVDLIPGVAYTLNFTLPDGLAWTTPNVTTGGGTEANDSDVNPSGDTAPVVLAPGENNPNVDAGLHSTLALAKLAAGSGENNIIGGDGLITYTLVVTNIGAHPASNVVISDPLTMDTSYITGSGVPTPTSERPLVWNFSSIPAGESRTIRFVAKLGPTDKSDPITNTAYLRNASQLVEPDNFLAIAQAPIIRRPTAVTLVSFAAQQAKQGVEINWQTSLEQDSFGFHLYRAEDGNREHAARITTALIPATGRNGGANYRFVDEQAEQGKRHTYWLHEVELNGSIDVYGPINYTGAKESVNADALSPQAIALPGGQPMIGIPEAQVREAQMGLPVEVVSGQAIAFSEVKRTEIRTQAASPAIPATQPLLPSITAKSDTATGMVVVQPPSQPVIAPTPAAIAKVDKSTKETLPSATITAKQPAGDASVEQRIEDRTAVSTATVATQTTPIWLWILFGLSIIIVSAVAVIRRIHRRQR